MNIGIIGSGNIGGALTRRFRAVGYEVSVAKFARARIAHGLGAGNRRSYGAGRAGGAWNDVVITAIPAKNVEELSAKLFADVSADRIIIDTGNYYPRERDGRIDDIEAGSTESGWVEPRIGHPVVKAFNMILAAHILGNGEPAGASGRIAVAVAGDDPDAKSAVMHLVDEIGFDTVDAGSIAESWRQQPGSPVSCKGYDFEGVRHALSEARQQRAPEFRATSRSPGTHEVPARGIRQSPFVESSRSVGSGS